MDGFDLCFLDACMAFAAFIVIDTLSVCHILCKALDIPIWLRTVKPGFPFLGKFTESPGMGLPKWPPLLILLDPWK